MKEKFTVLALLLIMAASVYAQKKAILIESRETIQAKPEVVYAILKSLETYPQWSPFLLSDPEQKHYITGVDGALQSTFHWEGVSEKSLGTQTLTACTEDRYLRFDCDIQKPFKGQPVFEYQLIPTEQGTEIIQKFELRLSGFAYFMTQLFGVKKEMIATNKLGLERLKALVEEQQSITLTHLQN